MKREGIEYRCPHTCPIGKKCFVIKLSEKPIAPLKVLQKCKAKNGDIKIILHP